MVIENGFNEKMEIFHGNEPGGKIDENPCQTIVNVSSSGVRVGKYGGFHGHGGTQKWLVYRDV